MKKTINKMDNVALTYGYVKFTSETDKNDVVYELVCIELMNEWFEEFRTINEMLGDMELERHNGFVVVNYLPKSMHYVFNVLNHHLTLAHGIKINFVDDQIMFLCLICKIADKDMIDRILKDTESEIKLKTWKNIVGEPIDIKNCFDEKMRLEIYRKIYLTQTTEQNKKFLDFYGLCWFDHNNKHNIYIHHKTAKYDTMCKMYFRQHRVFDGINKIFYKIMILGNIAVLFCPERFRFSEYDDSKSYYLESSDIDLDEESIVSYSSDKSDSVYSSGDPEDFEQESLSERENFVTELTKITSGSCEENISGDENLTNQYVEEIFTSHNKYMPKSPKESESDSEDMPHPKRGYKSKFKYQPSLRFKHDNIPQLKNECVGNTIYYNYVVDTVDVHINYNVINMKLILTSRKMLQKI